jgi:hypothetical protein
MPRKLMVVLGLVVALTLGFLTTAARRQVAQAAAGDSVVVVWNEETLEAIRTIRRGPTVNTRALAIVHTAIYDAWSAYDPVAVGARLGGGLRQPASERTQANKERAVSFAADTAYLDLYPTRRANADALMATLDQILDADRWQPLCVPTPPPGATSCTGTVQRFLTPHWRTVTPFALTSASQFRGSGPAISLTADGKPNGKYRDEVDKMTQHSKQLDDTRKVMAEYWADGPGSVTPPGHWNVFAQYVSRRDANTLDKDARMYFVLNNALLDASITAWDGKRNWDSVRPITAVRWLNRGKTIQAWGGPYQGPSYIKGEDWIPYQPPTDPAPPFAEYTSGHSTFSMAAAEVLGAFCGRGTSR